MYIGEKYYDLIIVRPALGCRKAAAVSSASRLTVLPYGGGGVAKRNPTRRREEAEEEGDVEGEGAKLRALLVDYADYRKHESLLAYIRAGGALDVVLGHSLQLTTPLCEASKRYDTCAMNTMFERAVDVNFPDGHGNTPLFLAAKCHKVGSVAFLLQRGADPDRPNRRGHTPLSVALENFSNLCAEQLVEAGASVNVKVCTRRIGGLAGAAAAGESALSPLLFALLSSPSPFPMAQRLMEAGALPETISETAFASLLNRPGTRSAFIALLAATGFRLHCRRWVAEQEAVVAEGGEMSPRQHEFLDTLCAVAKQPTSLQAQARTCIRTTVTLNRGVKGHIRVKLDLLPLPKPLLRYLKLQIV